jgi:hypothetical protein
MIFKINLNDHETWSTGYHVGIHVDFTSILQSHISSVGPSKTWTGSAFSTNESVHGLSVLCVKWPYAAGDGGTDGKSIGSWMEEPSEGSMVVGNG